MHAAISPARAEPPLILALDIGSSSLRAAVFDRLGRAVQGFDEAACHQRTGCLFHPSYLPARLRRMAAARPDWLRNSTRWVSPGEFLELRLFGQAAVSYSVAAWTGLLDRRRLCWDEPLLAGPPIDAGLLSPLVDLSIEQAPDFIGPAIEPRPDWRERYCIAIERQRELYATLVGPD